MNVGDYVIIQKPKYREGRMLAFNKEMDRFDGCYGLIKEIRSKAFASEDFDYPVYIIAVYDEQKQYWDDSLYGYYEDWFRGLTKEEEFKLISVVL